MANGLLTSAHSKRALFYAQHTLSNPCAQLGWRALHYYVEDYFTREGGYGGAFYFHAGNRRLEVQQRGGNWAFAGTEEVHDTPGIFAECLPVYDYGMSKESLLYS